MAGRINLYLIFRKIHLYTAMVVWVFLSMYFITGFLLARNDWFDHDSIDKVSRTVPVDLTRFKPGEDLPERVREMLEIKGKLNQQKHNEDGTQTLRFIKPGRTTVVTISADRQGAKIETTPQNSYEMVSSYHRMHGYGDGLKYDLYLIMMDLTSVSLIVFIITGIYLWLNILRNKFWGMFFLALGFLYTGWIIITFMIQ